MLGHGDGGAAPGRGGCSYSAPAGDCEHVAFHACVNRRARAAGKKRLHIAPWMLALYDYDASPLKPAQLRSEPLLFDRSRYPSSCEYARRQAAPRIALPFGGPGAAAVSAASAGGGRSLWFTCGFQLLLSAPNWAHGSAASIFNLRMPQEACASHHSAT